MFLTDKKDWAKSGRTRIRVPIWKVSCFGTPDGGGEDTGLLCCFFLISVCVTLIRASFSLCLSFSL